MTERTVHAIFDELRLASRNHAAPSLSQRRQSLDKLRHACIAPDYVLVPAAQCETFAQLLMAQVKRSYPTVAANADYSGILLARQRERLTRALDEARAGGATISLARRT